MAKDFAKAFYKSRAWQACRNAYITQRRLIDGAMCEVCCEKIGEELHHKIFLRPTNIKNPEITLNHENLILLCKDCHFKEHKEAILKGFNKSKRKKVLKNGIYFDENGMPKSLKVYIVYGAPGAGKTTYVQEHRAVGDLIVDLDLIKQAISMAGKTAATDNLLDVALGIRDYMYSRIESRQIDTKNVWVIAALPKSREREQLAKRLRAELIFIDTSYDNCIKRAMNDHERENKTLQKEIIDKWFDTFSF